MIHFTVLGTPIPQGSMRSIGKGRMVSDNSRLKAWRKRVVDAARLAAQGYSKVGYKYTKTIGNKAHRFTRDVLYDEPVVVIARFYFPCTSKYRDGELCFTRPDLDKLNRAIGDALESADIVSNDSRICAWPQFPAKLYGQPRAEIRVMAVREIPEERILTSAWDEVGI